MSVLAHFNALSLKHAQLKDEIYDAYAHHLPDAVVTELKKQKLLVKEEMLDLQKKHHIDDMAA